MNHKVIFFDKDNTLIKDNPYNCKFEDVIFFKNTLQTLRYIKKLNYKIFIISNQSAIGREYFSKKFYEDEMNKLLDFINIKEKIIVNHYYCPHHPDENCSCRKPKNGLLLNVKKDYNINIYNSIFVGDKYSDALLGLRNLKHTFLLNMEKENILDKIFNEKELIIEKRKLNQFKFLNMNLKKEVFLTFIKDISELKNYLK